MNCYGRLPRVFLPFSFWLLVSHSWAQSVVPQANVWYFGKNRGFDFSGGSPTLITGGLNTTEGCSVLCDAEGNFLFSTDGVSVWNRQQQPMPHGTGLKGHFSSTQSALIVPNPLHSSLFYLFTTDEGGYYSLPNEGVNYSVVDLSLENGLGDVVEATKNTPLYQPATEKLCAVHHANGQDTWVMTHRWESDEFVAHRVTVAGVSATPVVSQAGSRHYNSGRGRFAVNNIGEMKFSPDGRWLALAVKADNFFELFSFDAASGRLSLVKRLTSQVGRRWRLTGWPSRPTIVFYTSPPVPLIPASGLG
jgi:hypothetical protein